MSKPMLKTIALLALLSVGSPTYAEPSPLEGIVQGPIPYGGVPRYESSADILLQMPAQVDPRAPVPLGIRIFQDNVESITLLSDEVQPELLASFQLGSGVKPELSTRFRAWNGGIQVVVRTDNRIFAARRTFVLSAEAAIPAQTDVDAQSDSDDGGRSDSPDVASAAVDAVESTDSTEAASSVAASVVGRSEPVEQAGERAPSDGVQDTPDAMEGMTLRAWRGKENSFIELRPSDALSSRIEHLDSATQSGIQVSRFELSRAGEILISADIGSRIWFVPYFRFTIVGGKVGEPLVLTWWDSNGETGELTTQIDAPG